MWALSAWKLCVSGVQERVELLDVQPRRKCPVLLQRRLRRWTHSMHREGVAATESFSTGQGLECVCEWHLCFSDNLICYCCHQRLFLVPRRQRIWKWLSGVRTGCANVDSGFGRNGPPGHVGQPVSATSPSTHFLAAAAATKSAAERDNYLQSTWPPEL